MIVVKGSAAVDCTLQAMALTQRKTIDSGTGNMQAVMTVFHTQLPPFSCLNTRPLTKPPITPQRA